MRVAIFLLFALSSIFSSAQQRTDLRKLTFLQDTEVSSLCLNCEVQDCQVFLLNTSSFTKLEKIKFIHFPKDQELIALKYLPSFKALELEDPSSFNIEKRIKELAQIERIKHLSIVSTGEDLRLNREKAWKAKKSTFLQLLQSLNFLELRNVRIDGWRFTEEVDMLQGLDTLIITGVGFNMNYLENLTFDSLSYLGIDHGWLGKQVKQQLTIKVATLELHNPTLNRNRLGNRARRLALGRSSFEQYKDFYPSEECIFELATNDLVASYYPWYKAAKTSKDSLIPTVVSDFKKQRFFGSLATGKQETKAYSVLYQKYNEQIAKSGMLNWDTTSYMNRKQSVAYSNGYPTPVLWKEGLLPPYLSKTKIERIREDYQSFYRFRQAEGVDNGNIIQIVLNEVKRPYKLDNAYPRYEVANELESIRHYTIEVVQGEDLTKRYADEYIQDIWFVIKNDSIAIMHVKLPSGIEQHDVFIRNEVGGETRAKLPITLRSYFSAQRSSANRLDRMTRRWKNYYDVENNNPATDFRAFRKKYMSKSGYLVQAISEEEYNMTDGEWMEYHAQVMSNEKEAVLNADISKDLLETALKFSSFTELTTFSWRRQYQDISLEQDVFGAGDSLLADIDQIYLFDKALKTYTRLSGVKIAWDQGGLFYYQPISLEAKANQELLLITKSGSFYMVKGYVSSAETGSDKVRNCEFLSPDIASFKTLFKMME